MLLIICDSTGTRHECMLLSASADHMRVALRGAEDVVALTQAEGQWKWEDRGAVEVESFVAGREPELVFLSHQPDLPRESEVYYWLAG